MKWYCTLHCQESNHQVCGLEPRFTFQRIRFFFIGFGTPKGNRTPICTLKGCRPMPFSRWEHIILSNCYHSICPYVLVSGVVDKSTSTFPLNGREVQLLSVKVVAHLSDVTASSPQSVTYGWHIRTLFSFALSNEGKRILDKPSMV